MSGQPLKTRERETVASLAEAAGVATSTVSRALNGDPRISEATRRRVAALAADRGYMPNVLARTLARGRSGLVGLVLGPVDNPFYTELMAEAVTQAAARALRLILLHVGSDRIEDATAEALLNYQVDGCLVTSAELSSRTATICADHGVPVVMVNRVPRLHAAVVTCDNAGGAASLARLLLEAGHTRFAVVTGNAASSTSIQRERGFCGILADHGAAAPLRVSGGSTYHGGFAAGRLFAEMPAERRPDAVFAVADIMAIGVMDALGVAGLRVPADLSVVGFDGIRDGARPPYGLTTVGQPLAAMIGRGLDLLVARMGTTGLPDEVVTLGGELLVRRSARTARP